MKQIYDAAFGPTGIDKPEHLETYWWVDHSQGVHGYWSSSADAHDYVATNQDTVFVLNCETKVFVKPYHRRSDPSLRWIQTEQDGTEAGNLVTMAENHGKS